MEAAEAWAREHGAAGLSLGLFASNESALSLYKTLGFEISSFRMRKFLD
ncbi:MAG: GNAT family N-acetyltransferase [SAR202 cluster bacterium]|nr:GNAT family N-acetyltransferase [SAR202 cluster bacterium]